MQKTICDRCGIECQQYRARLYGNITHETNKGEQVGEDDIRPFDLCSHCMELLIKEFGVKFSTYGEMSREDRCLPVVPVRFDADHPVVADRIREVDVETV